MKDFFSRHNLLYRACASALIVLHLVTFGPIRDAFAFSASSANYTLTATLSTGGNSVATAANLLAGTIGEPCAGEAQGQNYILQAGFLPTILSNPPVLLQDIPSQNWAMGSAKPNAFDLDDYITSPDGSALTFTSRGSGNIQVSIDPASHIVSFSQPSGWSGLEKVYFDAADTQGNVLTSNKVTLQVEAPAGTENKPAIVSIRITPTQLNEGDIATVIVKARDPEQGALAFNFSDFFTIARTWQEGEFSYAEARWQVPATGGRHYSTQVTVTDPASLTDSETILLNVGNFNHAPVLAPIADITVNEGELAVITPSATDSDNDPVVYYYSAPFDATGKWLTDYDSAGTHTITVIASDSIDTVSTTARVIVNNTNRPPQPVLTLTKYTVEPNEGITITLSATDPDSDPMSFVLKKDGLEIASGSLTGTYSGGVSYPSEGFYTISATVKDSGNLETTVSKDVQVASRKVSMPSMGDFNGDSLTDLGVYDSDTGNWEICLSQSGAFESSQRWLSGFGNSRDWTPVGGDFNGDAKSDIGVYNASNGQLKIALSTGSSFTDSGTWLTVSFASTSWQILSGNFNADKYTDVALYNKDTGEVKVALGTGSGFGALSSWVTGAGNEYAAMSGDFNSDSVSDLCVFKKSSGEAKVFFSNTTAFVDGGSWISGFAVDKDLLLSDFNHDGLTDIGYWDKSSGKWYDAISTGTSFVNKGEWLVELGSSSNDSATTGDFNGDGITDRAVFTANGVGINRWQTSISTEKPGDLLTDIDNGIGGKTKVIYGYAAAMGNELPFPVYVTKSVSLINTAPADRQASYTQNFNYAGGYFDAGEREFRGFNKVTVTDPITANYTETYFYQGRAGQDGALKGQIEKAIAYDGNSRKISESHNTYEVRKAGPQTNGLGFPALTETTTTVWEENASTLSTKDTFIYDSIGNVLEANNDGDISKTGDERTALSTYAAAYELGYNRPLESIVKDAGDNIIAKRNFEYYPNGNLKKEIVPILNSLTSVAQTAFTEYEYDSFGNLAKTTNAIGKSVITEYETTFYTYPERITNTLGHTMQYVYDPHFGAVTKTTDTNGVSSSSICDSLGRVTDVKNDDDVVVSHMDYPDFNTKVSTRLTFSTTEYIDGIGRKYKTVSVGEDGNAARNVVSEVFYNNRGLVEVEELAHYEGEDPAQISYVRYEYDLRGRVTKTTSDFPGTLKDASSSVSYLSPFYTEATDPKGHRKGVRKDVYGNNVEVIEFTSEGVFHTYYEYDAQNNLTKTTDNQGNIARIFYDSIGRKVKMIDPDMGVWLYEYDVLGNLKKQTDAKNQIMEFEYDDLNRLTKKVSLRGAGDEAILATYSYDDPAKSNCIGRLSKVTDQSGSTEFFYDKFGRELKSIKTIEATQYIVERTYDLLDRLVTLKYPDGEVVNYTYDTNSGALEGVFTTTTDYVRDITYNAKGQIKIIKYGNNTQTDCTYGQDLRLSQILTMDAGRGTILQNLNYDFDHNGNVDTLTDNLRSNTRTFAYDDLDRLKEAHNLPNAEGGFTNHYFSYDSIGNMLTKSDILGIMRYGENAGPHALTYAGGVTYRYDANGNMMQGKNKTMEYDAENRLSKVTESSSFTTFAYDGDGGRVQKSEVRGQTTETTNYVGSLFEISTEDGSQKTVKHIFAGANRVASVSLRGASDEAICYYHSDHLGSSNVITDQNGQVVQRCEYAPYGTIAKSEGTDVVNHKFTGKELDNTGLYFYGARYYDPEIGRFISADTVVQAPYDPQNLNRYSYCRNNPINYVDPTGHFFWIAAIIGAIVGAILGGVSAAISGGEIWKGILSGGISGFGAGFGFWGAVAWGAFTGAGGAALMGGNPGIGAGLGALGATLGYGMGSYLKGSKDIFPRLLGSTALGAVMGGIGSVANGGEFGEGAAYGAGYAAAGFGLGYGIGKAVELANYSSERQAIAEKYETVLRSLKVSDSDMIKVIVGDRPLDGLKDPGGLRHRYIKWTENGVEHIWEMGGQKNSAGQNIIQTRNTASSGAWTTRDTTNACLAKGAPFTIETTMSLSLSALKTAITAYESSWVGQPYQGCNHNSNYAVNSVVYGAGGSVPELGYSPSFGSPQ